MDYQFKYREFSEALYESLKFDPFYVTLEQSVRGNDQKRREAMLRYMDYSMIEAEAYGVLYIPDKHKHGVSIWAKPLEEKKEIQKKSLKKSFLLTHMGQEGLDCYVMITEFMNQKLIDLITSDAWYLSIVGLKPAFQGQHLGPGLIEEILKQTDLLKISTYLETFNPRNIGFYNRLGFKSIAIIDEPVTGAGYTIMLREPMP